MVILFSNNPNETYSTIVEKENGVGSKNTPGNHLQRDLSFLFSRRPSAN